MQNATLNFSTESSNVTASIESWKKFSDGQNFKTYNPQIDFRARLVKFYDIQISLFGQTYLINQGNITISIANEKHYYVPGSNNFYGNQTPLFSVSGYTVSGDVTVVVDPQQYETLKLYEELSERNELHCNLCKWMDGLCVDPKSWATTSCSPDVSTWLPCPAGRLLYPV